MSRRRNVNASTNNDHADLCFHMKKPMSGKIKKKMMKEERKKKELKITKALESERREETGHQQGAKMLKHDASLGESDIRNDLKSKFRKESKQEVDLRKEKAKIPFDPQPLGDSGYPFDNECFDNVIVNLPWRPAWNPSMTKEELERNENVYFEKYVNEVIETYGQDRLNNFELNLEVSLAVINIVCVRSVSKDIRFGVSCGE